MFTWLLPLSLGAPAFAGTPAEDDALNAAGRQLKAMVNSCHASSDVGNGAGRVELDVHAHAGELVSIIIHSELNNRQLTDCFCRRAPLALSGWIQAVEADAIISLPFVLSPADGSEGYSSSRRTTECAVSAPVEEIAEVEEVVFPPGQMDLRKVKVRGGLSRDEVEAVLGENWAPLERCYRADLIRWPGYSDNILLEASVLADGAVDAARFDGMDHNSIANCQIQQLREVQFPSRDTTSKITARIRYTAGDP
ncbi:MAG: hypothetical protein AAFV53_24385 [Myxococcota bacterium]